MKVSFVLPCYNPPADWDKNILSKYGELSNKIPEPIELIIVQDGTGHATVEKEISLIKGNIPDLKVVAYSINRGKGYAIRQGVAIASGDIIIYTDIDFPYCIESILDIYDCLKNDQADVAIGVKGASYYEHVPLLRKIISKYLRKLTKFFLSLPETDTQCGLKGFKKEVTPLFLNTKIDRYLFDLEFVRNSYKSKKYRIKTIPVVLNENIHFQKMNYRILFPEVVNFIKLIFVR